ncbi:MAG: hypothetical protein OEO84_05585 [Betaproteobacteria bacterium]|nr:hypothetical protein [Betaproteobacteria bacterium]
MSHARRRVRRELCALLAGAWACILPAMAGAADPEPVPLAQAPEVSAKNEVAAAAAPRPGGGESALIGVAPARPPENDAAPAPDSAPITAQGAQPAAAQPPAALGTGLTGWRIPPIRWGGYWGLDLRSVSASGQPRRQQLVESLNLRGSSYFWQPWFAQVSGDLTLFAAQERGAEAGAGASGAAGGRTSSTDVIGGGQLALFPMSRFPFTASYRQSDSRVSGELTNNAYTSRSYGLTQSYAPLEGRSNYRLSYDRNDVTSDAFGTDTAEALAASMNWSGGFHTLSVTGNSYTNTRLNSGDTSSVDTANATHSYRSGPNFAVESLANYNDTDYHLVSGALPIDLRSRYLQLNSFATWRPAETSPLRVSGGGRLFENRTGSNGTTYDAQTISAYAAATYALDRNSTLRGGGTVTRNTSAGASSVSTDQNVGADYNSDPIKLGEYTYGWNAGATLGNQTGGESSRQTLGVQLGQRVHRSIALDEGSALAIDASQTYSAIRDTLAPTSQSLVHSAGASWSRRAGQDASTLLSLNASDSRTRGYAEQHFQLVNLQASGQVQFSRYSSASANMTLQATRQTTYPAFATGATAPPTQYSSSSAGGNLSYRHARAFDVPRLSYYALLNLNQQQARTRFEGDINAPIEHVNWSLEQRLEYQIGRLETQLILQAAEIEDRTHGLLLFRILRRFGTL